jgi:SAM-dependent methyltransferase
MTDVNETRRSYDAVADEYTTRIYHELDNKPKDRELLDRFADRVRGKGRVCDLGCGPGHVARYLHDRGVDVFGVDLSPGMVASARKLNPDIEFQVGAMQALPFEDEALAGIAAFYSIIHISREQVTATLRELRRVLQPGGVLFLAFHRGAEIVHLAEWWEKVVDVDFTFFETAEMEGYLREAGFELTESIERAPYAPDIEHQSQRVYIMATR